MSENSNFNAIFGGGSGGSSPTINRKYGSFRSQLTQGVTLLLPPTNVGLEYTDESDGVSVSISGAIAFTTTGKYMLDATILFKNNSPMSANSGYVWIRKNGVDVDESRRLITLYQSVNMNVLTLSYLFDIGRNTDTIELYFSTSSPDMEIYYDTSVSGMPNASSVIVNVFQIA
tara:strand:- start:412 stop:930 length:519 start_codon:yes stop_codon:yes gene_type:complete